MERDTELNIEEFSTRMPEITESNEEIDNERPISAITHQSEVTNLNEINYLMENSGLERFQSQDSIQSKTKLERKKSIFKKEGELLICLAVDGSEHSDFAFSLVVKEFLALHKLLVVYVYDSSLDEVVNYKNRRDTIISKYSASLTSNFQNTQYEFVQLDKNVNNFEQTHPLDLVCRTGMKFKSSFLVCGYGGMKGPRGDNKELSKGINFLLINSRLPTVIVKEGNLRVSKTRPQKGYKWLFVFDRSSSESKKILPAFLPLINTEMDTVHALTLLPSYINFDDIKKGFLSTASAAGIKEEKIVYESQQYTKNPADIVVEKINFCEKPFFDFIVFYNNPERFQTDKNYDVSNIVLKCSCNICFINGGLYRPTEEFTNNSSFK